MASVFFTLYRGIGFATGIVTAACNIYTLERADERIKRSYLRYMSTLWVKANVYGVLWPITPLEMYYNREAFLVLGKGAEGKIINIVEDLMGNRISSDPRWKAPN